MGSLYEYNFSYVFPTHTIKTGRVLKMSVDGLKTVPLSHNETTTVCISCLSCTSTVLVLVVSDESSGGISCLSCTSTSTVLVLGVSELWWFLVAASHSCHKRRVVQQVQVRLVRWRLVPRIPRPGRGDTHRRRWRRRATRTPRARAASPVAATRIAAVVAAVRRRLSVRTHMRISIHITTQPLPPSFASAVNTSVNRRT